MKRLVILFLVCSFVLFLKADGGPSDLVIVNPYGSPAGTEGNVDELYIEFYDMTGKKLNLVYTIDPLTGKITIKGGTGTVIVSVTNKKTLEKKTSKVVFVSAG
ncbi:MAG: hypothetical protein ACK5UE_14230 [Chitinophagales bacterium]|jgi:hypothetical protein|nr:hypothetical protein [Sphingobacteriales bacterium]